MKAIRNLFYFTLIFQALAFISFMFFNVSNLDAVEFTVSDIGGTTTQTYTINTYYLFALVGVFCLAIIAVSFALFGFGLNEFGSSTAARYLSYVALLALFSIGTTYFFGLSLGFLAIFELFTAMITVVNIIDETREGKGTGV